MTPTEAMQLILDRLTAERDEARAEVERLRQEVSELWNSNQKLEDHLDTIRGIINPLRRAAAGQFLVGDEASEDNLRLLNLVADLISDYAKDVKPVQKNRKWTPPDWLEMGKP